MKIKNKELLRTLKYALIAVSAGVIQFVFATILELILTHTPLKGQEMFFITRTTKPEFIAATIGLALSVIWNCTFNRKYTFKAANNVPLAMCLALLFYVPFYPFQIWYMAVVQDGVEGFWGFMLGLVTCMIINGVLEFLWQRFVVFRKSLDTNSAAQKEAAREIADGENGVEGAEGDDVDCAETSVASSEDNATADGGVDEGATTAE